MDVALALSDLFEYEFEPMEVVLHGSLRVRQDVAHLRGVSRRLLKVLIELSDDLNESSYGSVRVKVCHVVRLAVLPFLYLVDQD